MLVTQTQLNLADYEMCIWYRSYIYALYIENTSKSDPHSYAAIAKKAQKKFWGSSRIGTHDLHNTDVITGTT